MRPILLTAAACALWPAASKAENPPPADAPREVVVQSLQHEFLLTDTKGMALYIYKPDRARGLSRCTDECAQLWPPLLTDGAEKPHGEWGVATRPEGTRQLTYKGYGLYRFSRDTAPLQAKGDGQQDVWQAAAFVPPVPGFVAPGEFQARWDQPYYVLADVTGRFLYTARTASACVSGCPDHLAALPAPMAARAVGDWRPVDRSGARYWSFKGKIVYTREDADASAPVKSFTPIRLQYEAPSTAATRLAAR